MFKEEKSEHKPVYATFKTSRIVNARTSETEKKHELNFIISHRFGDAAGKYGGAETFFGTDNSTDIRIAFDYGVTNRFTVGIARYKGATALRQIYEINGRYKILTQKEGGMPVNLTVFGNGAVTAMSSNVKNTVPDYFEEFSDRWSFTFQPIISKKFSSVLSMELLPTLVHYNRVMYGDANDTYSIGVGGRYKFSKRFSLIADYFIVLRSDKTTSYFEDNRLPLYNPLGVGFEMETGGHIFQMTFTNSMALIENQFIPYTSSSWKKGQYRWGFNFTRTFSFSKHPAPAK